MDRDYQQATGGKRPPASKNVPSKKTVPARNGMGKEEIRVFIAAIADELKLRKPETLAAIFKVTAAVLRYQEAKTRV